MPLTDVWRRYGNSRLTPYSNLAGNWRLDLLRANRPKPQRTAFQMDNDDCASILEHYDDERPANSF
ncbi:hypothetical protein GGD65_007833 [Bradyrhizobium sp. CIR18]|uniref:hypothetical protein n=1 Tax=Bradyrhizobium sp. CIR18 TaxID=2663839 RepID=UPI001605AB77|nr:hypothetical protein [Bradyrhizobium sp. CIR18]MBB4366759.1 hypothetical protein [Bradyrhizobium sp. CIR18]